MKSFGFIFVFLLVFILSGCVDTSTENNGLSGNTPPNLSVEMDGKSYGTKLGSYC